MTILKNSAKSLLSAFIALTLVLGLPAASFSKAHADEPYTYAITLLAGAQGHLANQGVTVESNGAVITYTPNKIIVNNLALGDRVSFANDVAVTGDDSRYYVRGIRMGGRDNSTANEATSITVTQDRDYVVAYGLKGNLVEYTVQFQDVDGNQLMPSRTYYGNVGDMPVVAYLYLDRYRPQAYNLTGTLSEDPAENVFTFVYTPLAVPEPEPEPEPAPEPEPSPEPEPAPEPTPTPTPDITPDEGGTEAPAPTPAPEPAPADQTPAPAPADQTPAPAPAEQPAAGGDAVYVPAFEGGDYIAANDVDEAAVVAPAPADDQLIADDGTPLAPPEEIINIDDNANPLASGTSASKSKSKSKSVADDPVSSGSEGGSAPVVWPLILSAAIFAIGLAMLITWFFMTKKRKKAEDEVD